MLGDVRTADVHRQELSAPAPASLPVKPVSLALPDQITKETVDAAQQAGLAADELSTIRVFQANTPSVVNVTNIRAMQSYYSMNIEQIPAGTGSGFVWDRQGHVVTNFHVIKGASEVKVTLLDQSTYSAKVVGFDPDKDVAVLQLDMPEAKQAGLQPVSLGSSTGLMVGQRVYAIGNPFGLDHTLTQGIISGLGRELSTGLYPIKNVIQTDAAINPGNSGGVLLDSKGNLIGINTAIADPTGKGASAGVGFAIPIDTVKGLVDQILQYGRVMRPSLGVVIAPPQALQRIGEKGVLVLDVTPGSPAARAGLRPTSRNSAGDLVLGDIIQSVDGNPVSSARDLLEQLDAKRVGDKVVVDVLRGGRQRLSFSLQLADRVLGSGTE
ncbi:trypsin-like cysteine/serine peptidase domain-containing protein [Scenedesmus sp. NREL 46B-D3]|nr:trypsin-like cysteine/serine peptidase domain-containing protein [Scenedesmus sp. NREL 46B-D3]